MRLIWISMGWCMYFRKDAVIAGAGLDSPDGKPNDFPHGSHVDDISVLFDS